MIEFRNFLAIGKKGAGKTAIFKMLVESNNSTVFTEGYNLNDYPWDYHSLQQRIGIPDNEKFTQSWLYLMLISVAKILINKDQSVPFDTDSNEAIDILRKFIEDSYGTTNPELTNIFLPQRKLRIVSLSAMLGKCGIQLPVQYVEMTELPHMITEINRSLLEAVFKCANPQHKYYICFDELDIGFNPSDDYYNQIIGLLRAAREFNLKASEKGKTVEICIFLRDDIYDSLRFEDKRKFTSNYVSRIEWDSIRTDYTLKSLMNRRFSALLSEHGEDVCWDDVFDHQSINGKVSKYSYISEMTCLRPRDIIDYCNLILASYKSRGGNSKNKFENQDVISARFLYSKNLLEEFDDEICKHLPDYELYLDVIKKLGKNKFSYDEFKGVYEKNIPSSDMDAETCLLDLFRFSVIGNYVVGGTRGGSQKVFKYKDSRNELKTELPIIVHPGLVPVLGIREK